MEFLPDSMWQGRLKLRQYIAVLVSTTLALPLPAGAAPFRRDETPAHVFNLLATPQKDEGTAGVSVQRFVVNGKEVTLTIAQVDAKDEAKVVEDIVKANPERTAIAVSGPMDPALQPVKKSGLWSKIKTIFVDRRAEQLPALQEDAVPQHVRQKVVEKIKTAGAATKNFLKENKGGLLFSVGYAGGMSLFTLYTSGSVDAMVAQFIPTLLWSALLTTFSNKWFDYLNKSGELTFRLAQLVGREISPTGEYLARSSGQFLGSFAANTLLALYTLYMSGSLEGLAGLAGVALVGGYGFLLNSNVIDPTVARWRSEGKISDLFVNRYMILMQLGTATVEIAAFFGVPFTGLALGALVAAGLGYLLAGPTLESKVSVWKRQVAEYARRTHQRARFALNAKARACEKLLLPRALPKPPSEPFVSWAAINYGW